MKTFGSRGLSGLIFVLVLVLSSRITRADYYEPKHANDFSQGSTITCSTNQDCVPSHGMDSFCERQNGNCRSSTGICRVAPDACTLELNPVCGCDGNTYSNPCLAASEKVSVAFQGPCPEPLTCASNSDCPLNEFCDFPDGVCDIYSGPTPTPGTCRRRPTACNRMYDPVCGCDGQTYDNSCIANSEGTSVRHEGRCQDSPNACTSSRDCDDDEFCSKRSCTSRTGTCETIPQVCPQIYSPVCGCDNVTYSNACEANSAGQNIASNSTCPTLPTSCRNNKECGRNEFCNKTECNAKTGTCQQIPRSCSTERNLACGCDGRTYQNSCVMESYGVSLAHMGRCARSCRSDKDCSRNQFCEKANCTSGRGHCTDRPRHCHTRRDLVCGCNGKTYLNACIMASWGVSLKHTGSCNQHSRQCRSNNDCPSGRYCNKPKCRSRGTCEVRPDACTLQYQPVCGCDDKTYGNSCTAAAAGVSVQSNGECPWEDDIVVYEDDDD